MFEYNSRRFHDGFSEILLLRGSEKLLHLARKLPSWQHYVCEERSRVTTNNSISISIFFKLSIYIQFVNNVIIVTGLHSQYLTPINYKYVQTSLLCRETRAFILLLPLISGYRSEHRHRYTESYTHTHTHTDTKMTHR